MFTGKSSISRSGLTTALWLILVISISFSSVPRALFADGTETLGPPTVVLANGSRMLSGGTGLFTQPSTIVIDVPADAEVRQVLLYWNGFDGSATGTPGDSLLLNGAIGVTGDLIGGPTQFFAGGHSYTYRADITGLGLVTPGSSSVTLEGAAFGVANNGASLVVIVDEGSPSSVLQLRDGQDLAYINFADPLDTTIPQIFTLTPVAADRDAELTILAGSVDSPGPPRPTIIRVITAGMVTDFPDVLSSINGRQWDDIRLSVVVPAGADSISVQALSEDCCATGNLPASLAWVAAGLTVFPLPGEVGGSVFFDLDDDGLPDAGETGLEGLAVQLRCAGADGLLDTVDDVIDGVLTNAQGDYLFLGVPAGECRVSLDTSGLPLGAEVGQCATDVEVVVVQGGPRPTVEFCLRPDTDEGTIADRIWLPLPSSDGVVVLDPDGNIVGTLDNSGQLGPVAVAVGPDGTIWVLYRDTGAVVRYTNLGVVIDVIPVGGDPTRLVVDSTGSAWVASVMPTQLVRVAADGTVRFGPGGADGPALATAGEPRGLGVDSLDNLYVITEGPPRLEKRNAVGEPLAIVEIPAGGDPAELVLDRAGHVWIVFPAQDEVERRASDLSLIETFPLPPGSGPAGLVIRTAAEAWVLGSADSSVHRLVAGGVSASFTIGGSLSGITVDGRGQIWVGDEAASTAVRLDATGQVVETVSLPGAPRFRGDASGVTQANVLLPSLDFDSDGFVNSLEIDTLSNPFDDTDAPSQIPTFVPPPESLVCLAQVDQVTLTWSLPLTGVYTAVEVRRNGSLVATLAGNAVEYVEPSPLSEGVYAYGVRGIMTGQSSLPTVCAAVVGPGQVQQVIGLQVTDLAVNIFDITTNPTAVPGEPVYYLTDPANGKIYGADESFQVLIVIDSPLQAIAPTTGIAFNPDGNGGLGSLVIAGGSNGDPFQEATVLEIALDGTPLGPPVILTQPGPGGGGGGPIFGNSIRGGVTSLTYKRSSETFFASSTQNCELFSFRLNPAGGGGPGPQAVEILPDASATHPLPGYALNGVYLADFAPFDENGGRVWVTGPASGGGFELIEIVIASGVAQIVGDPIPLGGAILENSFGGFTLRADALSVVGLTTSSVYQLGSAYFVRGDTDDNGLFDVGDAIRILSSLFESFPFASCVDAYDFDDNGAVDIVDGVGLLGFMFGGGPPPSSPILGERGPDPTPDSVPCL